MERSGRLAGFRAGWRWAVWLVYASAWTTALLTPQPVELADSLLGEDSAFLSGKVLHVGAYAFFAALTGWLRAPVRLRWLLLAFLSLHAFGTEFFQGFVPLRVPAWNDVALDHVGILLGCLLSWKWWRDRPRGLKPPRPRPALAAPVEPARS